MKYKVKRDKKVLKSFKTQGGAERYLLKLKGRAKAGAYVEMPKSKVKTKAKVVATPKPRNYREATIERIQGIIRRGIAQPRYALVAIDGKGTGVTIATTRTVKGAKYLRRKARGFTRRVLQARYNFRIVQAA